jgi:hypothetical protein
VEDEPWTIHVDEEFPIGYIIVNHINTKYVAIILKLAALAYNDVIFSWLFYLPNYIRRP